VSVNPQLDRPGGYNGPADCSLWVCGSRGWQAFRAQACGVDIVQVCVGLEDMAWRNRDRECVYLRRGRTWGCGLAQQRSYRLVQAWRAQPSRTEIMPVCISSPAGLAGVAGRAEIMHACAGLGGTTQ
jgi:hypothetical protein